MESVKILPTFYEEGGDLQNEIQLLPTVYKKSDIQHDSFLQLQGQLGLDCTYCILINIGDD